MAALDPGARSPGGGRGGIWPALVLGCLGVALAAVSPTSGQVSFQVNRILQVQAVGTAVENCAALRAALAGITDAAAENSYIVRLEPGIYDCGPDRLTVAPWISLVGTGEESVTIVGYVDSGLYGVVHLRDRAELRSLSVINGVNNPSFGGFAVSVFEIFDVEVYGVRLEEVSLYPGNSPGPSWALRAAKASFSITRSNLFSDGMLLDDATVQVSFSILEGYEVPDGGAASHPVCRGSTQSNGVPLETNCTTLALQNP